MAVEKEKCDREMDGREGRGRRRRGLVRAVAALARGHVVRCLDDGRRGGAEWGVEREESYGIVVAGDDGLD